MGKERIVLTGILFLLVLSVLALAEECGFFCKVEKVLFGTGGEEKALAGKAGGIWGREEAVVGK